jgi:hypothetical protein
MSATAGEEDPPARKWGKGLNCWIRRLGAELDIALVGRAGPQSGRLSHENATGDGLAIPRTQFSHQQSCSMAACLFSIGDGDAHVLAQLDSLESFQGQDLAEQIEFDICDAKAEQKTLMFGESERVASSRCPQSMVSGGHGVGMGGQKQRVRVDGTPSGNKVELLNAVSGFFLQQCSLKTSCTA